VGGHEISSAPEPLSRVDVGGAELTHAQTVDTSDLQAFH
jgi:hypothetical protein